MSLDLCKRCGQVHWTLEPCALSKPTDTLVDRIIERLEQLETECEYPHVPTDRIRAMLEEEISGFYIKP